MKLSKTLALIGVNVLALVRLKIPVVCKAKGFNADPTDNVSQRARLRAMEIYQTLGNFKV